MELAEGMQVKYALKPGQRYFFLAKIDPDKTEEDGVVRYRLSSFTAQEAITVEGELVNNHGSEGLPWSLKWKEDEELYIGKWDLDNVTAFNKLRPAEDERLTILSEECAEIIQAVAKIQRHGYDSFHPSDPEKTDNRELLAREIGDFKCILARMLTNGEVNLESITEAWARKDGKNQYFHHQ